MYGQENLAAALTANDRIHFGNAGVRVFLEKGLIILVASALEYACVLYFGCVGFAELVFDLFGKVKVINRQGSLINVVVNCFFTLCDFGMIVEDHID